ncbi:hypothetical protein JXA34_00275 [Patescibacteria group bacterium]|nr:hypothetical protein [Patescibacteria group bacterium]
MLALPDYSEIFLYFFGILIVSVSITLLFFLINNVSKQGRRFGKKLPKLPKDFLEDESYEKALRILDEARLKSLRIIADSKVFDDDTKKKLQERLEQISQKQLHSLEDVSGHLLKKYTDLISSEVEVFKESLQETTVESQKRVDDQVHSDYAEIKKELYEYKNNRITQIDRAVYKILAQVMSDIFGRILPMKEHEELVLRLLEDAKTRAKFEV